MVDRPPAGRSLDSLKLALDAYVEWPAEYCFKFIVPQAGLNHLLALLDGWDYSLRESRTGRYLSVTLERRMGSSAEVIAVYERVAVIEGVMAL